MIKERVDALLEPIGAWLPPGMIPKGTSQYVQGVEVPPDYSGQVPEGYDIIDLKPFFFLCLSQSF